ncbi:MAG: DUF389 domain-containing protein [Anaerolineales bacterium]|nr:DUF389 domain-containing protein [Anaerolineales bacterium]
MKDQPNGRFSSIWLSISYFWRRIAPPMTSERREEVQNQVRELSAPDFDFFLLVLLSSVIATLGLLIDSAATIIGAMLVAPLMAPSIGLGMASITGNSNLLRKAASALVRGALLSIFISFLLTLSNRFMPFIDLRVDNLPREVLIRTQPSPIDLGIALAGGLAAAFAFAMPNISAALPGVAIATALLPPLSVVGVGLAFGRLDIAGGALLLYVTNAVTISFASMLVFVVLGFSRKRLDLEGNVHHIPRNLVVSAGLILILLAPLTYYSVKFVRAGNLIREQASERANIEKIVKEEVSKIDGSELLDLQIDNQKNLLRLILTVRTKKPLEHAQGEALQNAIIDRLGYADREVELSINQVLIINLDPKAPPSATPTPTMTLTYTPGPSPTFTPSPTASPTGTPLPTNTATSTAMPTYTPTSTSTATPYMGYVSRVTFPGLKIRQFPQGPVIGTLRVGEPLIILYDRQVVSGIVWIEVIDSQGRHGWVPQIYVLTPTPTLTGFPELSDTPRPEITMAPTPTH